MKSIKAPCIQTRIFYLNIMEIWLTAGRDFKLRHWDISKPGGHVLQTISIHSDEITDCVEIVNPRCIATCSLDRTIVMFDLEHREIIRTIDNAHEKGIRKIRYQNCNGAQMMTLGNECYANLWAPESLVSDIHIGKLKGHKKPIIDGQYLGRAPYIVTIDSNNVINFYDIQTLEAVQQLVFQSQVVPEGLIALNNTTFWTYGKRMV